MFNKLADNAHQDFEARHLVRENALKQTRKLTRHCANAIRAIHRDEQKNAEENMDAASSIVANLFDSLKDYPEFYFSGYTQDALKEYVEARLTINFLKNKPLPSPEEMGIEYSTYLKGMAEPSEKCAVDAWISCARVIPMKRNACSILWMRSTPFWSRLIIPMRSHTV